MSIVSEDTVLYTVKEVSQLIHTNQSYAYSLIKAGLLPVLKLDSYIIRKEALIRFLEDNEGKGLTVPNKSVHCVDENIILILGGKKIICCHSAALPHILDEKAAVK